MVLVPLQLQLRTRSAKLKLLDCNVNVARLKLHYLIKYLIKCKIDWIQPTCGT